MDQIQPAAGALRLDGWVGKRTTTTPPPLPPPTGARLNKRWSDDTSPVLAPPFFCSRFLPATLNCSGHSSTALFRNAVALRRRHCSRCWCCCYPLVRLLVGTVSRYPPPVALLIVLLLFCALSLAHSRSVTALFFSFALGFVQFNWPPWANTDRLLGIQLSLWPDGPKDRVLPPSVLTPTAQPPPSLLRLFHIQSILCLFKKQAEAGTAVRYGLLGHCISATNRDAVPVGRQAYCCC